VGVNSAREGSPRAPIEAFQGRREVVQRSTKGEKRGGRAGPRREGRVHAVSRRGKEREGWRGAHKGGGYALCFVIEGGGGPGSLIRPGSTD